MVWRTVQHRLLTCMIKCEARLISCSIGRNVAPHLLVYPSLFRTEFCDSVGYTN